MGIFQDILTGVNESSVNDLVARLLPTTTTYSSLPRYGEPGGTPDMYSRSRSGRELDGWRNESRTQFDPYYPSFSREQVLTQLQLMDRTDLVSAVADMQAEDATADSGLGEHEDFIEVNGAPEVVGPVKELFHRIGVANLAFPTMRDMIVFGDSIPRLSYDESGVRGLIETDVFDVTVQTNALTRQIEGYKEAGRKYRGSNHDVSWPFDYVQFSLQGRRSIRPYGQSVFYAAIRPWAMLSQAEDRAILYRLTRQPDRLMFKLDVGQSPVDEATRMAHNFRNALRQRMVMDQNMNGFESQFRPMSVMQDIILPVRSQSNTDAQILTSSNNVNDVTDLNYYARKFLVATRTPPTMFGFDDARGSGDPYQRNKSLAFQDIRYAMHIARIQRAFLAGLRQIAVIHLRISAKSENDKRLDYDHVDKGRRLSLKMPASSYLREMQINEVRQLRLDIAERYLNLGANPTIKQYELTKLVLRDVLKMDEKTVNNLSREVPDAEADALSQPIAPAVKKPPQESEELSSFSDGVVEYTTVTRRDKALIREWTERDPVFKAKLARLRAIATDSDIHEHDEQLV